MRQINSFGVPTLRIVDCQTVNFVINNRQLTISTMAEIIPIEPARIIPGREMIARLFYGPATIRFAGRF